ncbi:alpha/beta hydrolase family protein [Arthrobacter sp. MMS24-S77]
MVEIAPVGGGGSPRPKTPEPDGPLRIRGGVGGINFQFEELLAGAAALDDLVHQLQAIEREAEAVRVALFPYQASSYTSGSNAIIAVGESGRDIGRVREQLQRIGDDVRASHREYEFAESHAAIRLRMGLGMPVFGAGLNPLGLGARDATEGAVQNLPLMLAWMMGLPLAAANLAGTMAGPTDVGAVLRAIVAAPGLAFLRPRPINVSRSETTTKSIDLSASGLLRELNHVSASSEGEIEVVQVDRDGERAWVVLIPGTQLGKPPGGSNPLDEAGIAEALGYESAETSKAIRQALREAGAAAGESVVAVGHSQGGIHAMNLSQDKAFLAEYDLKFVVTAGSPVGGITPEAGIGSLHLEHEHDWVPGADGKANADTKDRVTVTMTNPLSLAPGEDPGLGPAHKLAHYEEGANLVQLSSDPSLAASTATLGGILGAGGVAKVSRFRLNREAARPARVPVPRVPVPSPSMPAPRIEPPAPSDIRSGSGGR